MVTGADGCHHDTMKWQGSSVGSNPYKRMRQSQLLVATAGDSTRRGTPKLRFV
jgi:hypothetical protein